VGEDIPVGIKLIERKKTLYVFPLASTVIVSRMLAGPTKTVPVESQLNPKWLSL